MKKILSFLSVILMLSSCTTDEIDVFQDQRYIYFNSSEGSHSFLYSFVYAEGENEVEFNLPLSYSGKMLQQDTPYKVEVVEDSTTAIASQEYELPANPTFKANSYQDNLSIKLINSSRLTQETQRLSLRLVSNPAFTAAIADSLYVEVFITNKISKPNWWNTEVEDAYLGAYSDQKLQLFIDHIYAGDYGKLSPDEKLHYARLYKYWLLENPHYEENGELITVPVIG